jgi:hypothetical protein
VCISDIIGDQALELLLARSIPELQLVGGALVDDVLDEEVDAYGFLDE